MKNSTYICYRREIYYSLKDFRSNGKNVRTMVSGQSIVSMCCILVNRVIFIHSVPNVDTNHFLRQPTDGFGLRIVFVGRQLSEQFFHLEVSDWMKRRGRQNIKSWAGDVVHRVESLDVAPRFQDAKHQIGSVITPYVWSVFQKMN